MVVMCSVFNDVHSEWCVRCVGRLRYLIEVRMVPGEGGGEASEDYWTPCSHFDELFSEQVHSFCCL